MIKMAKKKPYVVAVIPARGGSKRLPKKNILPIAGKPALAYTIEAALKSRVIDRVILSTDSDEIAEVGKRYGAEVPFKRPAHLATDTAHTPPVIEHAVNFIEKKEQRRVDIVFTLQPNCPMLRPEHIREGLKKFLDENVDSLISVKRAFPPWWLLKKEGNRYVPFVEFKKGVNPYNLESQQLPPVYQLNGVLYITNRDYLKREGSIINPRNNNAMVMNEEDSYDIDTEIDLIIAEKTLESKKKSKNKK